MKTKSENLFDDYCEAMGYNYRKIPAGSKYGKTSDRDVQAGQDRVIVEIKELTPNPDDKRQAAELAERGWTIGGGKPGRRVQNEIIRAAPQLKQYQTLHVPLVLVLYDNIVIAGERPHIPNKLLEPSFIDFAMYGLQTEVFARRTASDQYLLEHLGSGRGGKRQTTASERIYISAIAILYQHESQTPFLFTYHNYFAEVPLPFRVFSGPNDRHFVKPAHPDQTPQEWALVNLDSNECA
jgi:hypothetical protein